MKRENLIEANEINCKLNGLEKRLSDLKKIRVTEKTEWRIHYNGCSQGTPKELLSLITNFVENYISSEMVILENKLKELE